MTNKAGKAHLQVRIAETDAEIMACLDCLKYLRPHLEAETFVETVREMEGNGFNLAYIEENRKVVAVAGYRFMHTLFAGDTIYVDDLVTDPSLRSRGYGQALVAWLREFAIDEGCQMLHLDSGVQRDRAHQFYFASGFHINCFHFAMEFDD
ncbi:GNAT family N-acetyltransferase [Woeseia oceani]|uniref:GNAT family N-acetyltransferase n=1 Tax=Woeseia oceani TaxID=1548547 RepID=UPI001E2E1F12|nr:GNAT family N-acetyltransferase [Woeseia oceani]